MHISSFSEDKVSLTAYKNGKDGCPYLLLRTFHMGAPFFSLRGAHELCIERDDSALQLRRWSRSEGRPKLWAILSFITWEGKRPCPRVNLPLWPYLAAY